jgi:hypothetical protein
MEPLALRRICQKIATGVEQAVTRLKEERCDLPRNDTAGTHTWPTFLLLGLALELFVVHDIIRQERKYRYHD